MYRRWDTHTPQDNTQQRTQAGRTSPGERGQPRLRRLGEEAQVLGALTALLGGDHRTGPDAVAAASGNVLQKQKVGVPKPDGGTHRNSGCSPHAGDSGRSPPSPFCNLLDASSSGPAVPGGRQGSDGLNCPGEACLEPPLHFLTGLAAGGGGGGGGGRHMSRARMKPHWVL